MGGGSNGTPPAFFILSARLANIGFLGCGETLMFTEVVVPSPSSPHNYRLWKIWGSSVAMVSTALLEPEYISWLREIYRLAVQSLPFHGINAYPQIFMQLPGFDPYEYTTSTR